MTPRVPEGRKLRPNSRWLGPPIGVRGLSCPSEPPTRVEPTHRRGGSVVATCPAGAGTGTSLPLEDSPTHRIQCGAAFVRSHYRPRITEVHSAADCAASVLSPSAALNGYDGTTPFHHTAYAASYTARSATLQATPQATPGAISTRQGKARRSEDPRGQARESRNEISSACNAIMHEQYVILYYIVGPPDGDSTALYAPPLRYKREALTAHA